MTNPLTLIPALYRKYVYATFFLVGIVFGAMDIASSAAWIDTAVKVYAYVGTGLGFTAASNVTSVDGPPPSPDAEGEA